MIALSAVSRSSLSLSRNRSMERSGILMVVIGADLEERDIHNLTGNNRHPHCVDGCIQFRIVLRMCYFRKRSIGIMGMSKEECTALSGETTATTNGHVQSWPHCDER
jgi:hypothetical protein